MKSRRTLALGVALAVAAVAGFATFSYVSSVEHRAAAGTEMAPVLLVKKDVPQGTSAEVAVGGGLVAADSMPVRYRPPTAVADAGLLKGKVAVGDLAAGQVLVDGHFVDPEQARVTNAERIPAGQVAVSVSVDRVRAVSGLVAPGDKVDVFATEPTADGKAKTQHLLYQNVDVLFVGQQPAPQPGEAPRAAAGEEQAGGDQAGGAEPAAADGDGILVTFAVPPLAASRIALASQQEGGGLYLALVPPGNAVVEVPTVDPATLFNGAPLTPYEG